MGKAHRAVVYCRISRDPEHTELGVRRQEADCRALCEQLGWVVVAVLVDDDRSAFSRRRRPGYEEVHRLIADGDVDALVAWHPDRITRHPVELEALIDLLERTATTVRTVQSGEYDLSTASGRMTARVVGAVARHESEHKSARLKRKHLELAEAGKLSGGGTRPFGYEPDRVTVRESEAVVIRRLVADVLAGSSLRSLCARLDDEGVATVTGAPWTLASMRRMLLSPRIAGIRTHRGGNPVTAEWPAIITADDHHRLRFVLADPARFRGKGDPYLLTGTLVCGLCGSRLYARPRADKRRCYCCISGPPFGGCGKIRTLADPIEDMVTAALIAFLDQADIPTLTTPTDITSLTALERIDEKLAELGELWAVGDIDRAGWVAARRRLETERADLSRFVVVQTRRNAADQIRGNAAKLWPTLAADRQRAIVQATIDSIVANAAVRGRNTFDPTRFTIHWAE